VRLGTVERTSRRFKEALEIYEDNISLFDKIADHFLSGTFHQAYANVLNQISSIEDRKDYADLALIEYTAASFHYEQAGHERFYACIENNIGFLLGNCRQI